MALTNHHKSTAKAVPIVRPGQRTPFKKCTEDERNHRVEVLANLMAKHPLITKGKLKQFCAEKFGLKHRHAVNYIARARQVLKDRTRMPKAMLGDIVVAKCLAICSSGSDADACKALRILADISGAAVKRVEQSGPAGGPIQVSTKAELSPNQIDRLLRMAEEQAAETNGHQPTEEPQQ